MPPVRSRSERSPSTPALLLAAIACTLLVLTGCSRSPGTGAALARDSSRPAPSPGRSSYTIMQMNLCLSGIADCYVKVAYPAALQEAAALIREARPDAVTISEACRGDVAQIARQTGYHLRFSTVIYGGRPFRCVQPGGRGVFGDSVLTKAAIVSSHNHAFTAQTDKERRRWLCASTVGQIEVCTAHLDTRSAVEAPGNDAQCAELAAILARRSAAHTVIFGGDVNRRTTCAPAGFWTRNDTSADQAPGLQQVYGSGGLRSPSARVVPFTHSDHDVLIVRAARRR